MSIMRFIRALSPKITRAKIEDDIQNLRKELSRNVIVSYQNFNREFAQHKYKSKDIQSLEKALQQRLHSRDGLTQLIEQQLVKAEKSLDTIERFVASEFKDSVYKEAINYLQGNILQYISLVSFVARYARNYLTLILIEEAKGFGQSNQIKLPAVEYKRLAESQKGFINALPLVSLDEKELEKRLSKIPKAFITEDTAGTHAANAVMDPLRMNFFDTPFNPLYLIGMIEAEWSADSYVEAIDDVQSQESLLLNMRLAQQNKNDPALESSIQKQLDRVQVARQKLYDKERKYGLR